MIDVDNVTIVIEDRSIPLSFAAADVIAAIAIRSSPYLGPPLLPGRH
jgi:hypothetical protein